MASRYTYLEAGGSRALVYGACSSALSPACSHIGGGRIVSTGFYGDDQRLLDEQNLRDLTAAWARAADREGLIARAVAKLEPCMKPA